MHKGKKFLLIYLVIWTLGNFLTGVSSSEPQISSNLSNPSSGISSALGAKDNTYESLRNEKRTPERQLRLARSPGDLDDTRQQFSHGMLNKINHENSVKAQSNKPLFFLSENPVEREKPIENGKKFAAQSQRKSPVSEDMTQQIVAARSCDVETSNRCIAWQTGTKSWLEAHKTCRQLGGFLLDRASVELVRNSSYIDVSSRSWLDDAGSGTIAVMFFDYVQKNIQAHSTSSSNLMWTGLTRQGGHYQWMTQIPSVEAVVDWADPVEYPERFNPGCPALWATEDGTFRLTPCDAQLPFACVLHPEGEEDESQIGYELISGGIELQVSSAGSVEPWIEISTEQFFQLELNCDVINVISREKITHAKVGRFWKKDDVYLGVDSISIHPADIHDPTKSGLIPLNITLDFLVPTKQGTFSCEVWSPKKNEMIKSNSILITLTEWETFIITVAKVEGSFLPVNILNILGNIFQHDFPYLSNMTKDLIGINIDSFEQNTTRVTYKFHLYSDVKWGIEYKMASLNHVLQRRLSEDSSIKLAAACLKEIHIDALENAVSWPFGRAGPIYPEGTQCQGENGKPTPGTCIPDFKNGGTLVPPSPEICKRFDACPRGYVNVNTNLCVSVTEPSSWENAFKRAYVTGQEKDIVELAYESQNFSILSTLFRKVFFTKASRTATWVSMKRMHQHWPIVTLKSGLDDFHSRHSIPWAELHPLYDKECVGFDFVLQKMFSAACDDRLPFVTVIDIEKLKNALKSQDTAEDLDVLKKSSDERCLKDGRYGFVPTYDPNGLTCIFKLEVVPSNWTDANEHCKSHGASLIKPYLGFMNWIYKKMLKDYTNTDANVQTLYMNLGNANTAVMIDDPCIETYDWLPETDFNKLYGVLERRGWTLTNISENGARFVLCEENHKITENSELLLTSHADGSILLNTFEIKSIQISTIRCYVNGNLITFFGKNSDGFHEIRNAEVGYYQCFGWTSNPTAFLRSNTILVLKNSSICVISIKIHHLKSPYNALADDRTFWNSSLNADHHITLLKFVHEIFNISNASIKVVFFIPDEFEDGKYEYAHLTLPLGSLEQTFEDFYWVEKLREIRIVNESWTVEEIRSTTGCERSVFYDAVSRRNLTFQRTHGSGEFLAEELCVNDESVPVSRTCHGDFLEGYFWSNTLSGHCNGSPSDVTKRLFNLQHNTKNYQSGTYANLTKNAELLQPADIHFIAVGLQNIATEQVSSLNETTGVNLDDLVSTVNNVLSSEQKNFLELNERLNSTNMLLESFERISLEVRLNSSDEDDSEVSSKSFISAQVLSLTRESSVIGYEDVEVNGAVKGNIIREQEDRTPEKLMARIILPKNLTRQIASKSGRKVHLAFTTLRNGKLFNERKTEDFNYTLNSYVIQASFKNEEVKDLEIPVEITFRPEQETNDTVCVFWDFRKNEGLGGWSKNGCIKGKGTYDSELTTCYCNHLTYFALLVNFHDRDLSAAHVFSLETITIIGGILSIFGLLMVFLTFGLFKKWRRSLTNKILVNLSVAVFFSMVIFLVGINQTSNHIVCRSVAVSLHYFILASFGWMLVEGVHQYFKFVKVLAIYIPGFLRKAAVCAWGLPFIPIICMLVYDSSLYESQDEYSTRTRVCWMSHTGFKYAFLPPLAITMAVNFILYAMIIRSAICRRPKISSSMTNRDLLINQVSMAVCVFFLLGFTWIFGLLAINDSNLIFSYMFSIFNTLQGFFIFVFHVCRERSVRTQWTIFLSSVTGNSTGLSSYSSAAVHSQSRNMSGISDSTNRPKLNDSSSVSSSPVVFNRKGVTIEAKKGNPIFEQIK